MLRRILAAVGLVLFLGAFAVLAHQVFHLERRELPRPPAANARAAEPGP